jgi:hypothetical protein
MTLEFTVGINIAGERRSVTVLAEDALIAALKVKHEKPEAMINYAATNAAIDVIRTSRLSPEVRQTPPFDRRARALTPAPLPRGKGSAGTSRLCGHLSHP